MIRNYYILGFLVFILLVVGACAPKVTKPLCNTPYIEFKAGECCLDSDNNKICDSDEVKKEASPVKVSVEQKPAEQQIPPVDSIKGKLLLDKYANDLQSYKPCFNFESGQKVDSHSETADVCFVLISGSGYYTTPTGKGGIKLASYGGDVRKTASCPKDKAEYTDRAQFDSIQQYCIITHDGKYVIVQTEYYIYQPDGNNNFGKVGVVRPEIGAETQTSTQTSTSTTSDSNKYDLANFPGGFIKDGQANGIIIVNDNMFNEDKFQRAVLDLYSSTQISKEPIKLVPEIGTVVNRNAIVIGNPCVNSLAYEIISTKSPNCKEGFVDGQGVIMTHITRFGNINILIAGGTTDDTIRAITTLADYRSNKNILKGEEITIR